MTNHSYIAAIVAVFGDFGLASYADFLESVKILICAICIVSSIGPKSLFFSPSHTEHPLSHMCISPWKKKQKTQSLQYMC